MNPETQEWSDTLKEATRRAVEDLEFLPYADVVAFKHITSGFGVISIADLLAGKLRMVDRETERETMFADADELIRAGWSID